MNLRIITATLVVGLTTSSPCWAWGNGPIGNAQTDTVEECSSPPIGTHDIIALIGLAVIGKPSWIDRNAYILGTEAPDNRNIPLECGVGPGYDDRMKGHSVEWEDGVMVKARAVDRAQEEADLAREAFAAGDKRKGSFHLGAMAHYIGDLSQYGHSVAFEGSKNHSYYETWAKRKNFQVMEGTFRPMPAHEAATELSFIVRYGYQDKIPAAEKMNDLVTARDPGLQAIAANAISLGGYAVAAAIAGTIQINE
jgi:hypothetical protein